MQRSPRLFFFAFLLASSLRSNFAVAESGAIFLRVGSVGVAAGCVSSSRLTCSVGDASTSGRSRACCVVVAVLSSRAPCEFPGTIPGTTSQRCPCRSSTRICAVPAICFTISIHASGDSNSVPFVFPVCHIAGWCSWSGYVRKHIPTHALHIFIHLNLWAFSCWRI